MQNIILADGRWSGLHGIGRFSTEVLNRLQHQHTFTEGPPPLSLKNLFWQPRFLRKHLSNYRVYFTPGFNPVLKTAMPFVMTIHDLIHLSAYNDFQFPKRCYYEMFIKRSLKAAAKILTVSQFSKTTLQAWTGLSSSKIEVVGNGVSSLFQPDGPIYQPGYPYLLHVGNTKPHKNVEALLRAFRQARIDQKIRLILTGTLTENLRSYLKKYKLINRVIFRNALLESELAALYRGALGLLFPSLYEGFGLPIIEAMASGIPVLTSNKTAMPEIADDAALLIEPRHIESIQDGIETIVHDKTLRENLIQKGLQKSQNYSWEKVATQVQKILETIE